MRNEVGMVVHKYYEYRRIPISLVYMTLYIYIVCVIY